MLPRKRNRSLLALVLMMLVQSSEQHGSGAPPGSCLDQLPRHPDIEPQTTVPPYLVLTSSSQVRQGDLLNITIGSQAGAPVPIGGFILQARQVQNPDKIVGKFLTVPDPGSTQIINCRGDNDTVTHSNPEDKPALTFLWQAPADFLGGIEFRATVAQSYATFWKNVESAVVEVVTPDTVTTTTPAPATTQRATVAPPVVMETKAKRVPVQLDSIYEGCADTKLCFGVPQNCLQAGNCKAVVAIFVAGDKYTFEIQGTDNPKYVAAALSMDNKMGDDSAMECVRNDNGQVNLFTSWTYPKTEPFVRRSDSPQDIVKLLRSSGIDGKLYCKFTRDVESTVMGQTFNLATTKYNLMVVSGDSMKDADRVGFHSLAYESTGEPLALSSVGAAQGASKLLLKLHGSFMIAAWLGSASLGILLARYFRQTWVGKQLGGKDIWFAYHRMLMVLTWLLTVCGFILILVEVGGWSTTGDNPHAITGIVTVVLCFIQPIGAYFRPHPGTKTRPIFNWLHWLLGNAAHILGIATIFLAVYLQKAELPSWSVFVLAAFVAFHVIMHVVLSLTVCVSEGKLNRSPVNVFPMKDMMGQPRQASQLDRTIDAPFSSFRRLLLGIYAPIVLIFVVAMICLVALAPIGETYNTIIYFRQTWVGKQLGGKDIWFAYHRMLMVLTWLLTVCGFILILVEVGGWSTTGDNPHAITGIVTVVLCFIQPIGAYFRPHPGTKTRPIFNWLHWLLGNAAHILGIATIFLAVYLQKAELPSWSVFVLAAFVAFHVIMHVVLSLTVCVSEGKLNRSPVNVFPMKDMMGQPRQASQLDRTIDAPFSSFRRLLLGIYAPIVLIFVVAMICLVALAPIGETYNTIMGA